MDESGQRSRAIPLIEEGIEANRQALDAGDRNPALPLENVALHLMRGDEAAAREWLERADQGGWADAPVAARDPLPAPLQKDPRFVAFLARIDRDVNAMRQRADLSGLEDRPVR